MHTDCPAAYTGSGKGGRLHKLKVVDYINVAEVTLGFPAAHPLQLRSPGIY